MTRTDKKILMLSRSIRDVDIVSDAHITTFKQYFLNFFDGIINNRGRCRTGMRQVFDNFTISTECFVRLKYVWL